MTLDSQECNREKRGEIHLITENCTRNISSFAWGVLTSAEEGKKELIVLNYFFLKAFFAFTFRIRNSTDVPMDRFSMISR